MSKSTSRSILIGLATVLLGAVQTNAQVSGDAFVPFNQFMQGVSGTNAAVFVGRGANRVANAAAFAEMRGHLLDIYAGVNVRHSYVLDSQYFDCVPVLQQPSARALNLTRVPSPPPLVRAPAGRAADNIGNNANPATQLSPKQAADKYGNALQCEHDTIPMRRITLDELAKFSTLRDFFRKEPNSTAGTSVHHYAHAYQNVINYGGNSSLGLWTPYVNTNSGGEIFSLSQHWYARYVGGKPQTVETGWQNYPGKYGTTNGVQKSRLFIYYTADGYNKTGCYNLDCKAFVQTNNTVHFGGGWSTYSTYGGAQYEIELAYLLYNGNWWLRYGSTWVGYYPGSLWGNANLATGATSIDYGGETVGATRWPAMGSGGWAGFGWTKAAYHRLVYYWDTFNGTHAYYANLNKAQPSPSCYTINTFTNNATWQTYFWFGGPGGTTC